MFITQDLYITPHLVLIAFLFSRANIHHARDMKPRIYVLYMYVYVPNKKRKVASLFDY